MNRGKIKFRTEVNINLITPQNKIKKLSENKKFLKISKNVLKLWNSWVKDFNTKLKTVISFKKLEINK